MLQDQCQAPTGFKHLDQRGMWAVSHDFPQGCVEQAVKPHSPSFYFEKVQVSGTSAVNTSVSVFEPPGLEGADREISRKRR